MAQEIRKLGIEDLEMATGGTAAAETLVSPGGVSLTKIDATQIMLRNRLISVENALDDDKIYDIRAYGAAVDGTTVDTSAAQDAIDAANAAGGGIVFIPEGTTVWNDIQLKSNVVLAGIGWSSIIKQESGANTAVDIADGISNIGIRNLCLQGTVAVDEFQEVLHLVVTAGVTNFHIDSVKFSGPRGDALYIGTGNERGDFPTADGHNKNVWVTNCYFDGEVKDNRQGISIIDCDSCWIVNNYFTRLSKQTMPAVIDIEPDSGGTPNGVSSIIRHINILYNKFYDNAGESTISMNFPNTQAAMTVPITSINIIGNDIDTGNYDYTVGVHAACDQTVTNDTIPYDITIRDNKFYNLSSHFYFRGVRGILLDNNKFELSRYTSWIGHPDGSDGPYDITFTKNKFRKMAYDNTNGGNAIFLYAGKRIVFKDNLFDTCGKADQSYNAHLVKSTGEMSKLEIVGNTFYQPAANSNSWDYRVDAGTLTAKTFRHYENRLINVDGGTNTGSHDDLWTPDWHAASFENSWVDSGGDYTTTRFFKDRNGVVHLEGSVAGGTTTQGLTIMHLGVGYGPVKSQYMVVPVFDGSNVPGLGVVYIHSGGNDIIIHTIANNNRVSLDGLSWYAGK